LFQFYTILKDYFDKNRNDIRSNSILIKYLIKPKYINKQEEENENGREKKNISKFSQLLLNVSIYTNLMKIFSINKQEGQLDCLNGIRFLSMGWVVLGHVFFYFAGSNLIGIFIYICSLY
jgi:hypothetical protein